MYKFLIKLPLNWCLKQSHPYLNLLQCYWYAIQQAGCSVNFTELSATNLFLYSEIGKGIIAHVRSQGFLESKVLERSLHHLQKQIYKLYTDLDPNPKMYTALSVAFNLAILSYESVKICFKEYGFHY